MTPLMSLWGDGWFYVTGGGFLLSCLLFVFLLGQYRSAIEAEEEGEPAPAGAGDSPAPAEKIYIPRPIEPLGRVPDPMPSVEVITPVAKAVAEPAPVPAPAPVAAEAPAAQTVKPAEKKKSETTTGGLSPAVVYLQNLKTQVDHLDKELGDLKGLASNQNSQGELILNRLAELVERLEALESRAPATAAAPAAEAPAPEAVPEPEPEPAPEPQAVVLQPPPLEQTADIPVAAEPVAEPAPVAEAIAEAVPASAADNTVVIEPAAAAATEPAAEPPAEAPAPEAEPEPEPEAKPARKGPVWPI